MPVLPRGGGWRKNSAARIKACRLRKKGLTYAEIGKVLGVTRQRVQQYISETGKGLHQAPRNPRKSAAAAEPKQLWRMHQYFPETATRAVS